MKAKSYRQLVREGKAALKEEAKRQRAAELERERLLNKSADFGLLEEFVQKVNSNPNLRVVLNLADGTRVELSTVKPREAVSVARAIDGVVYNSDGSAVLEI